MAIYHLGTSGNPQLSNPVITIGTFDGVHLGHRQILDEVKKHAASIGGESMVITFEPHPRQVLDPSHTMEILTPLKEKLNLIAGAGIDHITVTPFTLDFAQMSADDYVTEFLVRRFNPSAVVIGYDHHFGHDRKGDITLLRKFGQEYDFEVHEIPAHMVREAAISSTRIRNTLLDGNVANAAQLLGRPYSITGSVIRGQQLGRTLGYPTANLEAHDPNQLVPAQGVYAVRVLVAGKEFGAMLSIGTRPTVTSDGNLSIEACIFDFDSDIYGQEITIQFIQHMRDELKFDSLDELKAAIGRDEIEARAILSL